MNKILFVCQWNVSRSPIAEILYNFRHWNNTAMSIAGSRDRTEKYWWKPRSDIVDYMMIHHQIDMSNSKIQFLADLTESVLWKVEKVIFLYNPITITWVHAIECDDRCKKDDMNPYDYFAKRGIPIEIYHIDKLQDWGDDISGQINCMVKKIKTMVNLLDL